MHLCSCIAFKTPKAFACLNHNMCLEVSQMLLALWRKIPAFKSLLVNALLHFLHSSLPMHSRACIKVWTRASKSLKCFRVLWCSNLAFKSPQINVLRWSIVIPIKRILKMLRIRSSFIRSVNYSLETSCKRATKA